MFEYLVFLIVGLAVGVAVGVFYMKTKQPDGGAGNAHLAEETARLKAGLEAAEKNLREAKADLEAVRQSNQQLLAAKTAAERDHSNALEKLDTQKKELEEIQNRLKTEFKNIANELLEDKSKKFTEQNKTNMDEILKPFNEKIKDFEKKVGEAYDKEMRDKISLREEVKKLYELNAKISEEAQNLTKALKGDTKKQGNWGELILEKVLERSGLTKDVEYRNQVVTRNVDGEIIKPDVVVFLPDNKHLIIDSKVSLVAYDQFVNIEDSSTASASDLKERALREHIASVRNHVKLLSDKGYYTSSDFSTPDLVLLFMPIESAFGLAVQNDSELFNFAWDRRIVIVSPTTLLATLRTVSSLWKIESQNRHAIEIAEEGGKLYDKFVGFYEDLVKVGSKMDAAKGDYVEAMKKLYDGTGNLVGRVEKMKKLGAKATKALPPNLLERSNEA